MKREIVKLPIELIKPNPSNPRVIKDEQLEKLKKSLDDFSEMMQLRPIVIDENNVILGGNMRYLALKQKGESDVEVIKAIGLTEEQKRQFVIKDNVAYGDWDWDSLAKQYTVAELEDWGLEDIEIEEEEPEIIEDESPEPEEEYDSKPGHVYKLGNHRLICGDSTDPVILDKLMGGVVADIIITDPPYNVDYSSARAKKPVKIKNDNQDDQDFIKLLGNSLSNSADYLKPGGVFYIWYASRETEAFTKTTGEALGEIRQVLIWVKQMFVLGRQDYQWRHEPCLYGWKEGGTHYFIDDHSQTTVWEKLPDYENMNAKELRELLKNILETNQYPQDVVKFDKPSASRLHSTMKPVELIAYQLKNSSRPGEAVLDPFGGSGTTLIAAEQIGRTAYLVELDPRYCDVIRKRYWKLTNGGNDEGWQDGTAAIND